MPANVVSRILKNSTEAERKLINQFLKYPPNSAGSLMTIEFIDLKKKNALYKKPWIRYEEKVKMLKWSITVM